MNDEFIGLVLELTSRGVPPVTAEAIVLLRLGSGMPTRIEAVHSIVTADARLITAGLPADTLLGWAQQNIITRNLPDLLNGDTAYTVDDLVDAVNTGMSLHLLLKAHTAGIRYPSAKAAWDTTRGNHTWHHPIARLIDSGDLTETDLMFLSRVTYPPAPLRSRSGIPLEKALAGTTGTTRQAILAGTMVDGDVAEGLYLANRLDGTDWADVTIGLLLDGRSISNALACAEAIMRTPEQQAAIDAAREAAQQAARRDKQRAFLMARLDWHARTGTPISDRWPDL